jgi:hypothetical protein
MSALIQRRQNLLQYSVRISQHLVVPEAQHAKSMALHECAPLLVRFDLLRMLSLSSSTTSRRSTQQRSAM